MTRLRTVAHLTGGLLAALVVVHLLSVADFAARFEDPFFSATNRLSNPFWRFLDWTTLLVAVAHGAVTLVALVRGRVASPRWSAAAETAILACALLLAALATFAYFTLPLYPRLPGGP